MKHLIFNIIKIIIYLMAGVLVIVGAFINQILLIRNLNWIAGLTLLYGALVAIISDIKHKMYKKEGNRIPSHIIVFILSIIIVISSVIFSETEFETICVLWGICAILNSCFAVSEFIYKFFKYRTISIMEAIEAIGSILELALSVILILDPEEHITAHLVLLGSDYIIIALITIENLINTNKEDKKSGIRI